MFLLDTATSIIDVNNAIREITLTLTSDSPLSLSDRYALTDSLPWPVQSSLYAFEVRSSQHRVDAALNVGCAVEPGRRHHHLAHVRVLAERSRALDARSAHFVFGRFSQCVVS